MEGERRSGNEEAENVDISHWSQETLAPETARLGKTATRFHLSLERLAAMTMVASSLRVCIARGHVQFLC